MLHTETFDVVEIVETFLDLTVKSQEVILLLGFSNSDPKLSLRLD